MGPEDLMRHIPRADAVEEVGRQEWVVFMDWYMLLVRAEAALWDLRGEGGPVEVTPLPWDVAREGTTLVVRTRFLETGVRRLVHALVATQAQHMRCPAVVEN